MRLPSDLGYALSFSVFVPFVIFVYCETLCAR
jgi:hypothetical protein